MAATMAAARDTKTLTAVAGAPKTGRIEHASDDTDDEADCGDATNSSDSRATDSESGIGSGGRCNGAGSTDSHTAHDEDSGGSGSCCNDSGSETKHGTLGASVGARGRRDEDSNGRTRRSEADDSDGDGTRGRIMREARGKSIGSGHRDESSIGPRSAKHGGRDVGIDARGSDSTVASSHSRGIAQPYAHDTERPSTAAPASTIMRARGTGTGMRWNRAVSTQHFRQTRPEMAGEAETHAATRADHEDSMGLPLHQSTASGLSSTRSTSRTPSVWRRWYGNHAHRKVASPHERARNHKYVHTTKSRHCSK